MFSEYSIYITIFFTPGSYFLCLENVQKTELKRKEKEIWPRCERVNGSAIEDQLQWTGDRWMGSSFENPKAKSRLRRKEGCDRSAILVMGMWGVCSGLIGGPLKVKAMS